MNWNSFKHYQLFWGIGFIVCGAGLCFVAPIGIFLVVAGACGLMFLSVDQPAPVQNVVRVFEMPSSSLPTRHEVGDSRFYQTREVVIRNPDGWQIGERSTTAAWTRTEERY